MNNEIYIITVDTGLGIDVICVKTKPTDIDLSLIAKYYLTQLDMPDVRVDFYEKQIVKCIATDARDWIENELYQNAD